MYSVPARQEVDEVPATKRMPAPSAPPESVAGELMSDVPVTRREF